MDLSVCPILKFAIALVWLECYFDFIKRILVGKDNLVNSCLTLKPNYCFICCNALKPFPHYSGCVRAAGPQPIHPGITLVQCDGKLVCHRLDKKKRVLLALNRPLGGGYVSCTFHLELIWSRVTRPKSTKRISLRRCRGSQNASGSRRAIWRCVVKWQATPPCLLSPMCHSNRGRAPSSRAMFPSL